MKGNLIPVNYILVQILGRVDVQFEGMREK
jgi:hypothetical protein